MKGDACSTAPPFSALVGSVEKAARAASCEALKMISPWFPVVFGLLGFFVCVARLAYLLRISEGANLKREQLNAAGFAAGGLGIAFGAATGTEVGFAVPPWLRAAILVSLVALTLICLIAAERIAGSDKARDRG